MKYQSNQKSRQKSPMSTISNNMRNNNTFNQTNKDCKSHKRKNQPVNFIDEDGNIRDAREDMRTNPEY